MRNHNTTSRTNSTDNPVTSRHGSAGEVGRRGANAVSGAQIVESGVSPVSRTGIQLHPPADNRVSVDWLSGTFFPLDIADRDYFLRKLVKLLGGSRPAKRPAPHFTHTQAVLGTGKISYHRDRLEMGVHFSFPASALSNYCEYVNRDTGVYALMIHFRAWDTLAFSRIDLAIDTDMFTTVRFEDSVKNGELVTRLREQKFVTDGKGGHTIYLGSRSGDGRFVRCYNKAAEQGLNTDSVWTRVEVEHKGPMADMVVDYLLLSDVTIENIIGSAFDFRETGKTRTNNRIRSAWWSAFLGEHTFVSFAITKTKSSAETVKKWFRQTVTPALAYLVAMEGGDFLWLHDEVRDAIPRISSERCSELYLRGVPI